MITFERGDIFASGGTSFAHGCNCVGAMGAGIAVEFRRKWPDMYAVYHKKCMREFYKPGDLMPWLYYDNISCEGYVFNLMTQARWKADVSHITSAFEKMLTFAERNSIPEILMPAIGSGLGGLDWKDVKVAFINARKLHPNRITKIRVCEQYVKGVKMELL